MLGNSACIFLSLSGIASESNNLDPDPQIAFIGPDLGPNYVYRLSAGQKKQ